LRSRNIDELVCVTISFDLKSRKEVDPQDPENARYLLPAQGFRGATARALAELGERRETRYVGEQRGHRDGAPRRSCRPIRWVGRRSGRRRSFSAHRWRRCRPSEPTWRDQRPRHSARKTPRPLGFTAAWSAAPGPIGQV